MNRKIFGYRWPFWVCLVLVLIATSIFVLNPTINIIVSWAIIFGCWVNCYNADKVLDELEALAKQREGIITMITSLD